MSQEFKTNIPPATAISTEEAIRQADLKAKELDLAIKAAELEAKQLEKQEREFNLKDLKARIAARELKEKQHLEDLKASGRTFRQTQMADEFNQSRCTHKKGGFVSPRDLAAMKRGGSDPTYAVIKHQMINGDIWVRCLRCGKTWAPPVQKNFYFDKNGLRVAQKDGVFNQEGFQNAQKQYQEAVAFSTRNSMSTSVQCRFSKAYQDPKSGEIVEVDATNDYRNLVGNTNLR
jgi:hypothetical protein